MKTVTTLKKLDPHVLIIDDDPIFRLSLEQAAQQHGLKVTACGSLKELKEMGTTHDFDIVIVDYYLDDFKNYITGTDIARGLGATPVILVSANEQCVENPEAWPTSIRRFVHKKAGVKSIALLAASLGEDTL